MSVLNQGLTWVARFLRTLQGHCTGSELGLRWRNKARFERVFCTTMMDDTFKPNHLKHNIINYTWSGLFLALLIYSGMILPQYE